MGYHSPCLCVCVYVRHFGSNVAAYNMIDTPPGARVTRVFESKFDNMLDPPALEYIALFESKFEDCSTIGSHSSAPAPRQLCAPIYSLKIRRMTTEFVRVILVPEAGLLALGPWVFLGPPGAFWGPSGASLARGASWDFLVLPKLGSFLYSFLHILIYSFFIFIYVY